MHPVEVYLSSLQQIRSTGGGTAEESYYGCLENLLNEIGKHLKPKVRCVGQLQNKGAGEPDFGLFTANQFQRTKDREPLSGQLPERGVIEVKPWKDDSFATSKNTQVSKYWKRYGLVLVSNYHDFVIIDRDDNGQPTDAVVYPRPGTKAKRRTDYMILPYRRWSRIGLIFGRLNSLATRARAHL